MATPALARISDTRFVFTKTKDFLDGDVDVNVEIDATKDKNVALALLNNEPFPAGPIVLGKISAGVSGEHDLEFSNGDRGSISFGFGAQAFTGLGVYSSQQEVMNDLALRNPAIDGLNLDAIGAARYLALNWGYKLSGKASGSIALAPGATATFGVEGKKDAFFAVVRAFKEDPKAATAVADTLASWRVPRQVPAKGLDPGTWIMTEVNASVGVKLGAQFGYQYNWIRNVGLKGLSGEVGLRIQSAASVALGFNASGKFALVVGRESFDPDQNRIRMRLYKLRKKGWNFALNAGVNVTGDTGKLLPAQMDDFISGIFGVSGPQIVEDLKLVRKWVDPDRSLESLASEFLVDFAEKKLKDEAGIDVEKIYTEAHERVKGFLDEWDNLGNRASSLLWSTLSGTSPKAAKEFRSALDALAGDDKQKVSDTIRDAIGRVDYFDTPTGRWLSTIASKSLVDILVNTKEFEAVRDASKTAKKILDGEVIDELVKYVNDKFSIDVIRKTDYDAMDTRLKNKLAEFLKGPIDKLKLEEIRSAIDEILKKADKLYEEGVKALNRTYGFSIAYSYQKSTTRTALIDATLDLGTNGRMADLLSEAIDGNFRNLLTDPAVTIQEAVFTHQIERQSHLQLSMPYFTSTTDKLNKSFAKMEIQEQRGRVFVYDLDDSDEVTRKGRWKTAFAATMDLSTFPGVNVRYFGSEEDRAPAATTSYVFRQAFNNMGTAQLRRQLQPIVPSYFRNEFAPYSPEKASLDFWVSSLDKFTDELKDNGTAEIGDTLFSLEVGLPGKVLANWLKAPKNKNDKVYMQMSRNIQKALRQLIPFCYFQSAKNYTEISGPAPVVLLYSSLPFSTAARVTSSGVLEMNRDTDVYWSYDDTRAGHDILATLAHHPATEARMRFAMQQTHEMLSNAGKLAKFAGFYEADQLDDLRREALSYGGPNLPHLRQLLLRLENRVIRNAVGAGVEMANFVEQGGRDPEEALESLSKFGLELTSTFNEKLTAVYCPNQNLRNLSLMVFLEASRALGGDDIAGAEPTAILDVRVLEDSPDFPPKDFVEKGTIPADVPIAQRIIGTGTA